MGFCMLLTRKSPLFQFSSKGLQLFECREGDPCITANRNFVQLFAGRQKWVNGRLSKDYNNFYTRL